MKKKLNDIVLDNDFKKIERSLSELNIFKCLSIERMEIRHSNFIAFLLDPKNPHGLGDAVIRKLLQDIFSDSKISARNIIDFNKLNRSNIEVRREWNYMDILIILEEDIVVIENKVDAVDHSGQLKTYKEKAESTFPGKEIHYVYLTPFGDDPQDTEHREIYINYSYEKLAKIIEDILKEYKNSDNQKMYFYLSDYLTTIKRELLMNDELNKLAATLYKKHKEAFDFISKYKPEPASILAPFLSAALQKYGFIEGSQRNDKFLRFTTVELKSKLQEKKLDWPDTEIFSFKLIKNERGLRFQACIYPSTDAEKKKALYATVIGSGCYKKLETKAKDHLVFYKEDFTFTASEIINKDDDEIRKKVEDIVAKIKPEAIKISKLIDGQLDNILLGNHKS